MTLVENGRRALAADIAAVPPELTVAPNAERAELRRLSLRLLRGMSAATRRRRLEDRWLRRELAKAPPLSADQEKRIAAILAAALRRSEHSAAGNR
jgi:hypothetical protein